jgi:hypothetical protein
MTDLEEGRNVKARERHTPASMTSMGHERSKTRALRLPLFVRFAPITDGKGDQINMVAPASFQT